MLTSGVKKQTACTDMRNQNMKTCFLIIVILQAWTNVQSNESLTVYKPKFWDACDNLCVIDEHLTDPKHWCSSKRENAAGRVMFCQEHTYYYEDCVDRCGNSGDGRNSWCLTNGYYLDDRDTWDYCSEESGMTVSRGTCKDECDKRGKSYFWCHTDDDSSGWDYCSPSGRVYPLQFTIYGQLDPCISDCKKGDKDYYWCWTNIAYWDEEENLYDDTWDYCSPDESQTRYGKKCTDECLRRGSGYYWCHTDSEGNWDYCSPDPILGVHVSAEREFTRYGQTCRDKCSEGGKSYGWCQIYGRNIEKSQAWEYCSSKGPGTTIYGARCSSKCRKQGTSYFWCQTKDSWDYCSPDYTEWRRSEATLKSQSLTSIFITFAILNASKLF